MHLSDRFSQQDNHYSKLVDKFFKINSSRPIQNQNISSISAYFSTRRLSDAYHRENKSFKFPENVLKSFNKEENVTAKKLKKSALKSTCHLIYLYHFSSLILTPRLIKNKQDAQAKV